MLIKYYGPRGSLPTPGKDTNKYGGNTTCLSVLAGGQQLIIDGGSGLRLLGNELMQKEFGYGRGEAYFFWTHSHWDHIQGFPFFIPNFIPGNKFIHFGLKPLREVLVRQQTFINFPVEFEKMPSRHVFSILEPGKRFEIKSVTISTCAMNHPGGGLTYKFSQDNHSFVFATDIEHPEKGFDPDLLEMCRNVDLLIYDAQYTPEEYLKGHKGWGHSTWEKGAEMAKTARVKRLHLYHHDQTHSDLFLEKKILAPACRIFPKTDLAREGWQVEV